MNSIDHSSVVQQLQNGIDELLDHFSSDCSHITTQTMLQGGVEKLFELHLLECLNRVQNRMWVFVSQYDRIDIAAVSNPDLAPNDADEKIAVELKFTYPAFGTGINVPKTNGGTVSRPIDSEVWAKCKMSDMLSKDLGKERLKALPRLAIGIVIACWHANNKETYTRAQKLNTIASQSLFANQVDAKDADDTVYASVANSPSLSVLYSRRIQLQEWRAFHSTVRMILCQPR